MFARYSLFSFAIAAMLFCSQGLAVTLGDCADQQKSWKSGQVILRSEDGKGKCVTVEIAVAKQSLSVKTMLEDVGEETKIPIPLRLSDQTLVDIANILIEINGKPADETAQIIKDKLPKNNPDQLLKIIVAANFLDIAPLVHIGLDAFAYKLFVLDLEKLKTWNENAYQTYKKAFFGKLSRDLEQLMIARNLRSIDRVRLNDTEHRRQNAIKKLDLATAQIVAYIAKNVDVVSAKMLPKTLYNELEARKFTGKILFGLPDFAIWPTHCSLPGNANYDMSVGPHPDERYVDNKDGTVKDLCTNLIWEKSPSTIAMNWEKAKSHCVELRKANFDDWRLPNKFELESIVDKTKKGPSINSTAFPNTPNDWFWSSSAVVGPTHFVWIVLFSYGGVDGVDVDYNYRVRCVR